MSQNTPTLQILIDPFHPERCTLLGKKLILRWGGYIYPLFLLISVPLQMGLFVMFHIVFDFSLPISLFLTWWFNPLLERIVIFPLGKLAFGIPYSTGDWLKSIKHSLLKKRTLAVLTYARLHPLKNYLLCIEQLENKQGKWLKQRYRNLGTTGGLDAWIDNITLYFISVFSFYCIFILLKSALNTQVFFSSSFAFSPNFDLWALSIIEQLQTEPLLLFAIVFTWFSINSILLVRTICSYFALYLINRMRMEGWSIERVWKERQQKQRVTRILSVALVCLCIIGNPAPSTANGFQEANAHARKMFQDKKYGYTEVVTIEEAKEKPTSNSRPQSNPAEVMPSAPLSAIGYLIIGIILFLVLFVIWRYFLRKLSWTDSMQLARLRKKPTTVAGFAIAPESLPSNLVAAVRDLLQQNRTREALGLLLRGTLSELVHEKNILFTKADTEKDCLTRVTSSKLDSPFIHFFTELIACWQALAYGHQEVSHARIETLCTQWLALFSPNPFTPQKEA